MKYRNKKVTVDGMTFDSKKEYRRWCELVLMERAGVIQNLERQKEYLLIPAQYREVFNRKTGRNKRVCVERAVKYKADFVYEIPVRVEVSDTIADENGVTVKGKVSCFETVVEDTKGIRTADYIIKRKLMLYVHNIKIREI